ncbi:MAG: DNA repair and recombination protein RadB [Nanoarchaeota archaeon]
METKEERKISAGSYDLNKWLYGGYEKDIITMIAGPAGSGKTNFTMIVALSQAKKGNKVIFIDTEGGFSVERAKQLVEGEYEECMKNIFLLKPTNFEEQKKDFFKLMKLVGSESAIRLIIVDGMTMLYRLELGDAVQSKDDKKIKLVNREIAKQMRILAEIARKRNIPIIITNQVYSKFLSEEEFRKGTERETNLVGGDLLKYWSKCIIELKMEKGKRQAFLIKHRSLPEKSLEFEIINKGIRKKGWI